VPALRTLCALGTYPGPAVISSAARNLSSVIFTVLADSLDEARQKFRASGRPDSDALFIIKTETEIYLA
jgi:hypothetical protein